MGAIFSVRVLDARGDLVPGVTVEVRCEGGQCPGHGETGSILSEEMAQIASRTISRIGPDGTLRIGLPFAKAWVVWARWSGGGTAVAPFRIEPSEETRILRVPRLAAISGRVLLKGQPVRRFNVSIQRKDGHSTVAGKDGAFRFGSLPPGPATIRILSPQGWSDPMEIVLQPGEDRGDLEFEIRPGRFVVCRVTGKDGLPVLGAVVKIRSAQGIEKKGTWVSSAGLAHMIPAEPGRHTLRVYDIEGKLRAEREIEVKAGENANVTILLKEKW